MYAILVQDQLPASLFLDKWKKVMKKSIDASLLQPVLDSPTYPLLEKIVSDKYPYSVFDALLGKSAYSSNIHLISILHFSWSFKSTRI